MSDSNIDPSIETRVLTSMPTEWEAQLLTNVLTDNGIKVSLEGTQTAAFQAEAPGEVDVIVRKQDLEEAREILNNYDRSDREEKE